jgi:hypothetical protein
MACHVLGAPNMVLRLGAPTSVECVKMEGRSSFTFPKQSVLRFDFPPRGSMPAVKLFWYDGVMDAPYRPSDLPADELLGDIPASMIPGPVGEHLVAAYPMPRNAPQPTPGAPLERKPGSGILLVGDKGYITAGEYGGAPRLVPLAKMQDYKMPPQLMARTPQTHRDWIRSCKLSEPSASNFDVAGPFTEWILLGAIALRAEGKLEWDSARMRITNNSAANEFIKPAFRNGWKMNWKV